VAHDLHAVRMKTSLTLQNINKSFLKGHKQLATQQKTYFKISQSSVLYLVYNANKRQRRHIYHHSMLACFSFSPLFLEHIISTPS